MKTSSKGAQGNSLIFVKHICILMYVYINNIYSICIMSFVFIHIIIYYLCCTHMYTYYITTHIKHIYIHTHVYRVQAGVYLEASCCFNNGFWLIDLALNINMSSLRCFLGSILRKSLQAISHWNWSFDHGISS
jgi:hypothetical protein